MTGPWNPTLSASPGQALAQKVLDGGVAVRVAMPSYDHASAAITGHCCSWNVENGDG